MQKSKFSLILITIIFSIIFIAGVYHLYLIRFSRGDIFPEYSTKRSDRKGTKIFYKALQNLDNIDVKQNHLLLSQVEHQKNTTFIFAGLTNFDFFRFNSYPKETMGKLLSSNNRIIFLLKQKGFYSFGDSLQITASDRKKNTFSLNSELDFKITEDSIKTDNIHKANLKPDILTLPKEIKWNSNVYLTLGKGWKILYSFAEKPAIAIYEKNDYSVVICTGSDLIANENMGENRESELILYLLGKNHNIIFDESHFGTIRGRGISFLIAKYNLRFTIVLLLIFALLFIWKNTYSFLPRVEDQLEHESNFQIDTDDGLLSLLRENIKVSDIPHQAFVVWKRGINQSKNKGIVNKIENQLKQEVKSSQEAINIYNKITKIITEEQK